MNERTPGPTDPAPAEPEVRHARRLSPVWIVPLVAVVAAAWVAWQAWSATGPTVEITFQTAEGLEAGRTPVKYKDVQVGTVKSLSLDDSLQSVIVTVELTATMEGFVTDRTRFWVVRPRVTSGGVSGLGTLFSGAYIAMDPSREGRSAREFVGLEEPPVVTHDDPGTHYRLQSPGLGSLSVGAPVYFREIRAGEIVSYELMEDGSYIELRVFVRAPYDEFVRTNTRFWQSGGINVSLGADGISLETSSLVSMVLGGIAFDTPTLLTPGARAREDRLFPLFSSRKASEEEIFSTRKDFYLAYFGESARGLQRGAPVELHGMPVGKVSDVKLEFVPEAKAFRSQVLMEVHPERIGEILHQGSAEQGVSVDELVGLGLRAQLGTASLLTGARYVMVDIFPEAPPAELGRSGEYPVIPTIPSGLEEVTRTLVRIATRLDQVPLEEIGANVSEATQGLNRLVNSAEVRQSLSDLAEVLAELKAVAGQMNEGVMPAMAASMAHAERVLARAEAALSPDSPVSVEARRLLRELADAARSVRSMAEYLEQHPEALIRGKPGEGER